MNQVAKLVEPVMQAVKPMVPIGPKQFESLKLYRRSAILFGFGGAVLGCYALEWKAVLQYLPYYNGKYKEQ